MADGPDLKTLLNEILESVKTLKQGHAQISSTVDGIQGKVNVLSQLKQVTDPPASLSHASTSSAPSHSGRNDTDHVLRSDEATDPRSSTTSTPVASNMSARRPSLSSKITLTSYPGQAGVDPVQLRWGHSDPALRGPVIVARSSGTIGRRNGMPSLHCKTISRPVKMQVAFLGVLQAS